jgi:hypothetical protein
MTILRKVADVHVVCEFPSFMDHINNVGKKKKKSFNNKTVSLLFFV